VALQSLKNLVRLTYRRFLELFRHMVGLLGRVISPSQGLYLHRTTQHRKTRTNIHAESEIRTHDPSNQPAKTHASDLTATVTGLGILYLLKTRRVEEWNYSWNSIQVLTVIDVHNLALLWGYSQHSKKEISSQSCMSMNLVLFVCLFVCSLFNDAFSVSKTI
jgi:hypothetical protein